ncbi:hypothetical protein [Microbispora triticiradicis]|uniref:Uncharacterized protein n=2 Tax=Microbispora TaxID=2005 RepID=A0ABY3M573_9ACTN|nr:MULTISPECIES: hypothetical protein [Microbispora]TLP66679.1 hypothetical protein FED44_04295 [Microbispora fusca]TYB67505.1 hypothetical protein FXF59_02780 [Microbispora tritici]
MHWQQALLLGATGGLIVETIAMWANLTAWQRDRHHTRAHSRKRALPPLTKYVDPPADALVALTRLLMGAGAGYLMHDQVTGTMAAIAVGAAAPALLRQLGTARTIQHLLRAGESPPVLGPSDNVATAPKDLKDLTAPDRVKHPQTEGAAE